MMTRRLLHRSSIIRALLIAFFVSLVCAPAAVVADTTRIVLNSSEAELAELHICFSSDRTGADEIWMIRPDGSDLRQLTQRQKNVQGDMGPAVAPDYSEIAFSTYRFGGWKLALMNLDGSNIRRLTENERSVYEGTPSWSPDGTQIAFMRFRSQQGIWTCNADGSNHQWILDNGKYYYSNSSPSWHPDGTRILYTSNEDGDYELCMMNSDGTNRVQLTHNDYDDFAPKMSPDGTTILFYSNRDGQFETYLMDVKTERVIQLSSNTASPSSHEEGPSGYDALDACWSPSGDLIAFVEYHDGQRDIFVCNKDGSGKRRVTTSKGADYFPVWVRIGSE